MENSRIKVIEQMNGMGQQASTGNIGIRKLQARVDGMFYQPGEKNESWLTQLIFLFQYVMDSGPQNPGIFSAARRRATKTRGLAGRRRANAAQRRSMAPPDNAISGRIGKLGWIT